MQGLFVDDVDYVLLPRQLDPAAVIEGGDSLTKQLFVGLDGDLSWDNLRILIINIEPVGVGLSVETSRLDKLFTVRVEVQTLDEGWISPTVDLLHIVGDRSHTGLTE